MRSGQTRFLPKAVAAELRQLPHRLVGFSLLALALAGWLSLVSWSYADPSLGNAIVAPPRNWLGRTGASFAGGFMEAFGLASPLLLVPLAAFGVQIATRVAPLRWRLRLLAWLGAVLATPALFACLPAPSRWVLKTGLGGVTGDVIAARIANAGAALPPVLLWPLAALTLFAAAGFLLLRASVVPNGGVQRRVFYEDIALGGDEAPAFEREPLREPAPGGARFTSFAKRLLPRSQSLVKLSPRDAWLMARQEPSLPRRWRSKTAAPNAEAPASRAASPFANWGYPSAPPSPSAVPPAQAGSRFAAAAEAQAEPAADEPLDDPRIEPFFGPRAQHSAGNAGGAQSQTPPKPAPSTFRQLMGRMAQIADRQAFAGMGRGGRREPEDSTREPGHSSDTLLLPPLALLSSSGRETAASPAEDAALRHRAARLMDVLSDFGIKGRVCGACRGPLVTAFEFEPAKGTKATRVIGLADDIARLLGAPSGRIAAAPGRSTLSIELPNAVAEAIELRDLLDAPAFRVSQAALPLALGKSIAGEPAVADLTRMPHVLVAGAAASNIAMALHAIILSLLYRQPASQCSFMLIDTGRLNFSSYEGIAHLASLTADPARGVGALTWAVHEMGSRLERMGKLGVSTISAYNAKIASAQLSGRPLQRLIQTGFDPKTGLPVVEEELLAPTPMPYLVIAVSELEALMTAAQTDVEQAIEKVGRMGAAVGIHLIVATRHPTADVVTPQIKAGLQSRVSFSLPSKLESRVVLDEDGAEQLLTDGDMLYRPTAGALFRIHSPTVSDREVEAVARHLREPWRRTAGANAQGWDGEARRDDGDEDRRYEPSPAAMFDRGQSGMNSHLQRHFGSGREAIDDHMARRRPAWPPV